MYIYIHFPTATVLLLALYTLMCLYLSPLLPKMLLYKISRQNKYQSLDAGGIFRIGEPWERQNSDSSSSKHTFKIGQLNHLEVIIFPGELQRELGKLIQAGQLTFRQLYCEGEGIYFT